MQPRHETTQQKWSGAVDKEKITAVNLTVHDEAGSHVGQHMYIIHW